MFRCQVWRCCRPLCHRFMSAAGQYAMNNRKQAANGEKILALLAGKQQWRREEKMLRDVLERGLPLREDVLCTVIKAWEKLPDVQYALTAAEWGIKLFPTSAYLLSALIHARVRQGEYVEAERLIFDVAKQRGLRVRTDVLYQLLHAYAHQSNPERAEYIVRTAGPPPRTKNYALLWTALVKMWVQEGQMDRAETAAHNVLMVDRDPTILLQMWLSLISGYGRNRERNRVRVTFQRARTEDGIDKASLYNHYLMILASHEWVEEIESIVKEAARFNIVVLGKTAVALSKAYRNSENWKEAEWWMLHAQRRSVISGEPVTTDRVGIPRKNTLLAKK